MKPYLILSIAILAIAALMKRPGATPQYVLNLSRSAPVGFYRLEAAPLHPGAFAVVLLGQPWRDLARSRGYLLSRAWLIKPVAALAGDRICRLDQMITINGRFLPPLLSRRTKGDGRFRNGKAAKPSLTERCFSYPTKKAVSTDGTSASRHTALIANVVTVSAWIEE